MNLVDQVNQKNLQPHVEAFPQFKAGDEIKVHVRIKEGTKTRIQIFQGTCIAMKEPGKISGNFRVRKISAGGIGVERVFPFHSPNVTKIEVVNFGRVRRAKHFYLRDRKGKAARIKVDFSKKAKKSK